MSLRKDLSQGLDFLAAYTWGKTLASASFDDSYNNTTLDTGGTGELRIVRHRSREAFDARHRFSLAGTWELPFGRDRALGAGWKAPLDTIVGGWQASYLLEAQSGFPITIMDSSGYFPD